MKMWIWFKWNISAIQAFGLAEYVCLVCYQTVSINKFLKYNILDF